MTLHQAHKAAAIAHAYTHQTYVVVSGIDPRGPQYHFCPITEYSKDKDGRIVCKVD